MNYKEKYEAALAKAERIYESATMLGDITGYDLAEIFPELAESEDERIRKTLIEELSACNTVGELKFRLPAPTREECIAWLEKQKEQKFTHHQIDESLQDTVTHQMEDDGDVDDFVRKGIDDIVLKYAVLGAEWQKEQKPAEWSEEDEKMIERLITRLNWITYNTRTDGTSPNITFFDEIDWLKSLRPQYNGDVTMTEAYKMGLEAGRESGLRDGQKYVLDNADSYGLCKPTMWDKKDDEMWQGVYDSLFLYQGKLKYEGDAECVKMLDEEIYWFKERFKSLRHSWKPSEEQMEALLWCTAHLGGADHRVLAELYEHLKMYCL